MTTATHRPPNTGKKALKKPITKTIEYETPWVTPTEVLFEAGSLEEAEATVCITLYNYEQYIVDALHSVHDQTFEALGLVVLDDRSSDYGPARVERWLGQYASRFAGVKLLQHRKNKGLGYARNSAVGNAESEFVMILDADNELYPRCVARLVASLQDTDSAFAYSILERFQGSVGLMGVASWEPELLRQDNYIDAMALIRKSTWERVGGYTPMPVSGWEDYDFWCKCAESSHDGVFVPEILARYRMHDTSMLRSETDQVENQTRLRAHMVDRHPWLGL